MKKMLERLTSLVLAVVLVLAMGGVSTVLAATATTYAVSLDSGNVSIALAQNGTLTVTSAGGKVVKTGLNPALTVISVRGGNTTARTITVNVPNSSAALVLNGAAATLSAVSGSVQLSAPAASRLNGITGAGAVHMNGGVLTIAGNTAGTLNLNGGTVTATGGTLSNVIVNGAASLTAASVTSITKNGTAAATVTGSAANVTLNGGTLAVNGTVTNATVSGGTLTTGGAITGTATVKGGTVNAKSSVKAATVSNGTLNASGAVTTATVSGGILNASSAVTTATVSGGALNASGAVTTATVNGGTLNAKSGISNATQGGGKLVASGTVSGLTISNGEAAVSGSLGKAVVRGGTLTYTGSAKLGSVSMAGGTLNIASANLLPSGASITGGNLALGTKVQAKPSTSSTYTVKKVTGTYPESLGLPKTAQASITGGLVGQTSIPVEISWDFSKYDYDRTSTQTIYGTISATGPLKNAVQLSTTRVTAKVTLSKPSGGGTAPDPSYTFWMNLRDDISSRTSGTITVDASKYDDMPTSVLEELKGKKVTLIIERNGQKDIKITGTSMKAIPASQIFYKLTELAALYKNASGSGSSGSSSSSSAAPEDPNSRPKPPTPSGGGGTTGGTGNNGGGSTGGTGGGITGGTGGGTSGNKNNSSSSSSSSSSSEEESSSSSESSEEESSSEPEESEPESEPDVPADNEVDEPEPEKKGLNPIAIVAIVAAVVALAAGIISYIIMRRKQF